MLLKQQRLSPVLYLFTPLGFGLLLTLTSFRFPKFALRDFAPLVFPIPIIFVIEFARLVWRHLLPRSNPNRICNTLAARRLALTFGWIITAFCAIGLCTLGLTLLDNSANAYWQFISIQMRVRLVSLMCWLLSVLFFLPKIPALNRIPFGFVAIAFPIASLERNRLIVTFATFAVIHLVFPSLSRGMFPRGLKKILCLLLEASLFSILGPKLTSDEILKKVSVLDRNRRVTEKYPGSERFFQSAKTACSRRSTLPMQSWLLRQGPRLQRLLTFAASPLFNFQTISDSKWSNATYLKTQSVHVWTHTHNLVKPLPFVSPDLNVGNGFITFYLAAGPLGVVSDYVMYG